MWKPSVSPHDFFQKDDGLDITWFHATNNQSLLQQAIRDKCHMLEGKVISNFYYSKPSGANVICWKVRSKLISTSAGFQGQMSYAGR